MLKIVYFAWVREAIGRDEEQVERPGPGATVEALIALLAARGGGYAEALGDSSRLRACLLYTSPSPRDYAASRMPSSA